MTTPGRLDRALARALGSRVAAVAPAQVRGVHSDGMLVQVTSAGDAGSDPARTAFRIASCTKSFTAAAALLLAADGALDLDEPLADALDVPVRILGPAEPAPTIRDALAMRAGFPTDDPWGDRQEPLSDVAFAELLAAGVRTIWPARSRFEYSNLGYAIVGRIIGLRAGMPYRRVVEARLLEPLGLTGTGFDASVGNAVPGAAAVQRTGRVLAHRRALQHGDRPGQVVRRARGHDRCGRHPADRPRGADAAS